VINAAKKVFDLTGSELCVCVAEGRFSCDARVGGFEPFSGGFFGFENFHAEAE